MRPKILVLAFLLLAAAGCGDSPATPSPITPGSPQTPGAPTSSFTVTVDSAGSQEAIAGLSNVTVDASASTGAGARFEVAFGDGDIAATAVARHTYRTAGAFTVSVTVTDDTGRKTTSTRQVVVASPLGRWVHSAYIERRKAVEVRTLALSAQDGAMVRGVLLRDGNRTIPVVGTLTAERSIRLTLEDGSEVLEGQLPSVLSTLTSWPLTSRGNSIDGPITFTRVIGEPTGAAPDAVLGMRFFSFGAPFAVKQISPVLFDGSKSRGDGLTYYLEFGDGEVATVASATHPMQKAGQYVARLTVVDRFGRSDSEDTSFWATTLGGDSFPFKFYWEAGASRSTCQCQNYLVFFSQDGTTVTGEHRYNGFDGERNSFTGTITAEGEVRLKYDAADATLTGTLWLGDRSEATRRLTLTFNGGPHNGERVDFGYRAGE